MVSMQMGFSLSLILLAIVFTAIIAYVSYIITLIIKILKKRKELLKNQEQVRILTEQLESIAQQFLRNREEALKEYGINYLYYHPLHHINNHARNENPQ